MTSSDIDFVSAKLEDSFEDQFAYTIKIRSLPVTVSVGVNGITTDVFFNESFVFFFVDCGGKTHRVSINIYSRHILE